jgi:translation initiation factor IF-3
MAKRRNFNNQKQTKVHYKKNDEIRTNLVRLTGENVEPGVYTFLEAMQMAKDLDSDLVLTNPTQDPPICRIANYSKLLYEEKRKAKDQEKRNRETKVELKELRFSPNTGEGDIKHKTDSAIKFLKEGNKVKLTVQFKGRQMAHQDIGEKLLMSIAYNLSESGHGIPENAKVRMDNRRMSLIIKPMKK